MGTASKLPSDYIVCGAKYSNPMDVKNHFTTFKRRLDGIHTGAWDSSNAESIIDVPSTNTSDQLRSSRTTRNAEHGASRNRGGVFDYDPTDGLPVRKYVLETVKINQDANIDPSDAANKSAANKDNDFPWPEHELPTFFSSLQPHSQELLRRARQGDLDAKPSVWDKKKQEWVRADKAKSRGLGTDVLKSRHLMNVDLDQDADDVDDDEDAEDSGDEELGISAIATNGAAAAAAAGKKRKLATGLEERTIEVKKWVQVPLDKADKMPEPKYLADRRPGMGSLYTPAYLKSVTAYGTGVDAGVAAAGYDLGDGGGLGNAIGSAAPGAGGVGVGGEITPRKNMPPKRKKKKLGGPGRRKAVPVEAVVAAGEGGVGGVKAEDGKVGGEAEGEVKKEGEGEGEEGGEEGEDGSGEESEGEGSEEGEVNEEPAVIVTEAPAVTADAAPAPPAAAVAEIVEPELAPAPAAVPEVTVEEVKEAIEAQEVVDEKMEEVPAPAPAPAAAADEILDKAVEEVKEVEAAAEEDVKMDLLGSVEAAIDGEKGDE